MQNAQVTVVIGIALTVAKTVQYGLGLAILKFPNLPTWVKGIKTILDDVLPNPSLPQTRALLSRPAPLKTAVKK